MVSAHVHAVGQSVERAPMRQSVSIRSSLIVSLISVIVLLSGAILLTMILGARSAIRSLSRVVITQAIDKTEGELRRFFDPVRSELLKTEALGRRGILDIEDPEALRRQLTPIMRHHQHISSLMVADDSGKEFMLLRLGDQWVNRRTWTEGAESLSWVRRWSDTEETMTETLEALGYDPRVRPWYVGATRRWNARSTTAPPSPAELVSWTEPYRFFTTRDLGITAAVRFRTPAARELVVGFDIMLKDIQKHADQIEVLERGQIAILTTEDTQRIVGLSVRRYFGGERSADAVLLKPPQELGIRLFEDATRAAQNRRQTEKTLDDPVRFLSAGRHWWGAGRRFALASDREFLVMVLVPESDLLGRLQQRRLWVVAIAGIVLVLGIGRAVMLANSYSRPIEALVAASDRIRRGDLEPGDAIETRINEVLQLADAHERMRQGLATLMKLERDLQLARQIQQQTLPRRLPAVAGYEIGAWNVPADETGGDTYDVVGYKAGEGPDAVDVCSDEAEGAVLLLADATGHGIGPALSVLQLRAMLRMAIHIDPDISLIAKHMNEQLCTDLPEGRFITAWLGRIRTGDHTLVHFSAGQAPLLHYRAANGDVEVLSADTIPMGVLDTIETNPGASLELEAGDIFAVMSDGIFESTDPQSRQFGSDRASDVIKAEAAGSPEQIITALRTSLRAFTQDAAAADDRTIVIIKRL